VQLFLELLAYRRQKPAFVQLFPAEIVDYTPTAGNRCRFAAIRRMEDIPNQITAQLQVSRPPHEPMLAMVSHTDADADVGADTGA